MSDPEIIEGEWTEVAPKREPFFGPWRNILAFLAFLGGLALIQVSGLGILLLLAGIAALALRRGSVQSGIRQDTRH